MPDSPTAREDRAGATRRALLDAARRRFGVDGYAATSVQAIVEAADVTKGAFYHHFEHKEDLFRHVFGEVQREIGRRAFVVHVDDGRGLADGGHPPLRDLSAESNEQVWEHLRSGCRAYLRLHTEPEVQRIVLVDGRAVLPWSERHRIRDEHGVVLLRADLRRAIARRVLRPLPLSMLATMLAGSLDEACIVVTNAEDPDQALDEAMVVVDAVLDGLRRT